MTPLNENFGKQLQRMSQLAGIEQRPGTQPISESKKEAENTGENSTEKKSDNLLESAQNSTGSDKIVAENKNLIQENDDLFGDLNDIFTQQYNDLQGRAVGKLNKDLKTAMVLNNVNQAQKVLLDINTDYSPKTAGAKADPDTMVNRQTIYDKKPVEKVSGAEDEFERLKSSGNLSTLGMPVTFHNSETDKPLTRKEREDLGKWHPLPKDESIISYHRTRDVNGYETFTLSDKGKEQLEFLQRMISVRPLRGQDPNDAIEAKLLDKNFGLRDVVLVNSEKIIRDFFTKAVTPIVASVLKRTKAAPKDAQFDHFITVAIDHAIDATKNGRYNQAEYSNFGAWFMQVVKNKVIDQLKSITTFKVDTAHVYDMLSNMAGPLNIDSALNPKEAIGNYDRTIESTKTYTKNGVEHNYYTYIYNKPENAIADLDAAAVKSDDSYKKSPLRAQYLREPGLFYKSFVKSNTLTANKNISVPSYYDPEDVKTNLARTTEDPVAVNPEYFENYEDIPASTVIEIANKEINNILEEIARHIVVTTADVGEQVKLSGRENAKYPTLTKGKTYRVVSKGQEERPEGGGIGKKTYTVIDDTGKELNVTARALTPVGAVQGKVISKAKENEQTVVEIMRLLLQYGRMKPVYTKTVYFPKRDGSWIIKNVGNTVLFDKNGRILIPYAAKKTTSKYKDVESAPIDYTWTSEKYAEEVNEKLINDISKVAKEKGLSLPSQYFTADNEPRYKLPNQPKDTRKNTVDFINSIRNALRKYFGFTTLTDPIIKQNRDKLKTLISNWNAVNNRKKNRLDESQALMLKQYIREYIAKTLN